MLYQTRGLILRDYDLAEQDKILDLLSEHYGHLKLVAKGARRTKSRFAPVTQPLSYVDLIAYRSRRGDLDTLNQCHAISLFAQLKQDLLRMAAGMYLAELTAKLTPIREPHRPLFRLLLHTLSLVQRRPHTHLQLLLRAFELRLLGLLGYAPHLDRCLRCGHSVEQCGGLTFSVSGGGILCQRCAGSRRQPTISAGAVRAMGYLSRAPLHTVHHLCLSPAVLQELDVIPTRFIPYHAEIHISGYAFFRSLLRRPDETATCDQ